MTTRDYWRTLLAMIAIGKLQRLRKRIAAAVSKVPAVKAFADWLGRKFGPIG